MVRKSTLPANVLKTPLPGQRYTSLLLCTLLMMTSVFMMAPEMLIHKIAKPCINSTWIALLIHGFELVKTWLLIECNTAFYPILCNTDTVSCRFLNGYIKSKGVTTYRYIVVWFCLCNILVRLMRVPLYHSGPVFYTCISCLANRTHSKIDC